jgi:two-component system sensor histidine kinase FlrB
MSASAIAVADKKPQSTSSQVRQGAGAAVRAATRRDRHMGERERLANRFGHLLAALPAGVVVINGDGIVQEVNAAAQALLGEPLLGRAWGEVIARAFAPRAGDGCEISLRDGRRVSVATQALTPEPGQIVLLTDMTATRELQERAARHERLSAMGEMAAGLAHQIRTPLASALLYVSHLSNPRISDQDRTRVVERIRERLRHLEHLVSDTLLFARGGASVTEPLAVADLVAGLRQASEAPLKEHGCSLTIDDHAPGALHGNREALLGALLNLAMNAMQACGPGGRLMLQAERHADWLRLVFSDNGPGITAAAAARLFEPFFTTRADGNGLGLAVVQAVVRAHHGDIELQSQPGESARFVIRLPLIAVQEEQRT